MTDPHSGRWAGFKGYISQREIRFSSRGTPTPGDGNSTATHSIIQSWSHWAGRRIRTHSTDVATVDEVHLVPGWATKRPTADEPGNSFDVVLHISGFATSRRTPECLTRSQRAFLKLARSFASLPKPQSISHPSDTELQDHTRLLQLPPRPDEIPDDYEVETLDTHFWNSRSNIHEVDDIHLTPQSIPVEPIPAHFARLHENLVSRLKLFWASSLPSRRIQLSVFLRPPDPRYDGQPSEALLTRQMLTGTDGHFSDTFRIGWNDICTHITAKRVTSNRTHIDYEDLVVVAQVINTERAPGLHETPTSTIRIPITRSILRVISDIDDTVKITRVTDGARAIFNQVFVQDLEDTVIPEMAEWYNSMWNRGVGFHYVSNGPFELLPLLNQFISISKLPLGSIRLRSYAGRSFFNGLLSAPATRKKGNVVEVLDQFRESQFILIGDSGEQDLELYSTLAAERPHQIAGVFIRNVSAAQLENPTGMTADYEFMDSPTKLKSRGTMPLPSKSLPRILPKRAASDSDVSSAHHSVSRIPKLPPKERLPPTSYSFEPSSSFRPMYRMSEDSSGSITTSTGSSSSSSSHLTSDARPRTEGEKKQRDLQNRVDKARSSMQPHIVLRVFEDPKDCVEVEQIIRRVVDVI